MDEEPIWSVGLVIDDAESRALAESSVVEYMMEAAEGHLLRFASPPIADAEEIENLRMEVAASSAQAAEERALGIVYRARRAVGFAGQDRSCGMGGTSGGPGERRELSRSG